MYKDIKNKLIDLLAGLEYNKILLFGSRAREENREDSDYDVIISLKNNISNQEKLALQSKIRKAFAQDKIDIDIIIKNFDEYNYQKELLGNVVYYANREGILL